MSERLIDKLDITLGEVIHWDLGLGTVGAAGGAWIQLDSPTAIATALPVAAGIVGVVIGAVVGGVAVIAAFMDTTFLRRLSGINKKPARYVTPFVFTALLGIVGSIFLICLAVTPSEAPDALKATFAGIAGFFTMWTLGSVIPLLGVLLDFVKLKALAAEVMDEPSAELRRIEPKRR